MILEDGKGRGFRAAVDSKLRLDTHAEDEGRREMIDTGKMWSMSFDAIDPTGADDYFAYLTNTGSETYVIETIRISSTVTGILEFHKVTGTSSGGATMDITSRNLGSAIAPTGTFETGVNLTGLANAGVLHYGALVADTPTEFTWRSGFLLTPGSAVALLWDTSTGILSGTFSIYTLNAEGN